MEREQDSQGKTLIQVFEMQQAFSPV